MMNRKAWLKLLLLLTLTLLTSGQLYAVDYFWTGGTGDWNNTANWDQGLVPEAFFEEVGIINNGGVATLNTVATNTQSYSSDEGVVPGAVAGLVLGQEEGDSGTLRVLSGGVINFVDSSGEPTGTANIGLDGTGVLEVQGGGSLSTTLVDMNPGSVLEIGSGTGAASVTSTGGMWLAGRTITHGPGHTFEATSFVTFQGGSEYVVDLTSNSHTMLNAGGAINGVQGPLIVQTSNGYSPTLGTSWNILEGSSITGGGFVVDTSEVGPLAAGTGYQTQLVENENSQTMQLVYDAFLTMTVNTNSGNVTVSSESGEPIEIIGYSLVSPSGQLNPGNWNSLADNSTPGWDEAGTPTVNALSELNSQGNLSISSNSVELGSVYAPPTEFGVEPDLTFEYGEEGNSQATQSFVEFTGSAAVNNLLLTVDPETGEGQLKNSSTFDIELLGYSILSDSGSLDDGNWESLASNGINGWDEVASDQFALSELVPEGTAELSAGQAYPLGEMFSIGASRDLQIDFILSVEGEGEIRQGVVQYDAIQAGLTGDFDNDGDVDGRDFLFWQRGQSPDPLSSSDLADWQANYGAGSTLQAASAASTSAAAPVPEPSAICLAMVVLVTSLGLNTRKCDPSNCN